MQIHKLCGKISRKAEKIPIKFASSQIILHTTYTFTHTRAFRHSNVFSNIRICNFVLLKQFGVTLVEHESLRIIWVSCKCRSIDKRLRTHNHTLYVCMYLNMYVCLYDDVRKFPEICHNLILRFF